MIQDTQNKKNPSHLPVANSSQLNFQINCRSAEI